MDQFSLPQVLYDIIDMHKGLVLVTGPTGSGKSTTLAAIVNEINKTRTANVITVEDPVEFIHKDNKSIISHREVGKQTQSFAAALKAALREDPDVILVGEMRDLETVSLALTAAETGHLVFGTLHTSGAPSTINRIIDVFPPEQQAQIRAQISTSLKMVVTQRLFKHPFILAAAVVAMPHEKWGETPCAFVEVVQGNHLSTEELIQYCKKNLANFKIPRHFVFQNIEKTSTGKVQKFRLREHAKKLVTTSRPETYHSCLRRSPYSKRSGPC